MSWVEIHNYLGDLTADTGTIEPPKSEHIGPMDAAHRAVKEVVDAVRAGQVIAPARKALSDALADADKPLSGRAASDHAIGRAIRFG